MLVGLRLMCCRYAYASGALSGVTEGVAFSPFQVIKVQEDIRMAAVSVAGCLSVPCSHGLHHLELMS
jgi:hypothetical protein